ncbi:MAG: hypothetical protein NZ739_02920 [Verrucomicrobiae bacterium]|nr:hypothetical protein [Verrucomicrobiae bacterium]
MDSKANENSSVRLWWVLASVGWAPLGVVALHLVLAEFGLTERFDAMLHFWGGAAVAYFVFGLVVRSPGLAPKIQGPFSYLFAFTCACTAAVFWEFAEFALDRFEGTAIQGGLVETMLDLLHGVSGALVAALGMAGLKALLGRRA